MRRFTLTLRITLLKLRDFLWYGQTRPNLWYVYRATLYRTTKVALDMESIELLVERIRQVGTVLGRQGVSVHRAGQNLRSFSLKMQNAMSERS